VHRPAPPLAVLLLAPVAAAAEPFTAEHLVRIDRVGPPVLAPSGGTVAYAVRHTDMQADRGRFDLWVSSVAGGEPRRLTSHEANDTDPAWSNDRRFVWFLSGRSGSTQVWRIPIDGGEAEQVTDLPLDVGTFRLAPTGDRLVVSVSIYPDCADLACTAKRAEQQSEAKVSARRYDALFVRHWDYWLDERRSQLFSIALDADGAVAGEPINVSRIDADVPSRVWGGNEEYAISPDSRTVYFAARIRDSKEPLSTNFDIYAAPMNGDGAPENLTAANEAWDTQPRLSPNGTQLAYLAMTRPGFEADRFRVMLRDLDSGNTRVLTEAWDRSPASFAFVPNGSALLLNAQDLGQESLFRLDLDGSEPQRIVSTGTVSAFDTDGERVVYAYDDLDSPAELYVADLDGDGATQITHFGDRTLGDVSFGEYEQFTFAGAEGDTVHGYVVKPAEYRQGRRYPVAFLIHGGPQGSFSNNFHYRWNPQTYAGQGFAAVFIDFHGSTGYGQDFTDSITQDWGGRPLEDLKLGLAAALERYAFLDGDRVCALGASYGGYMVNWIAGQWADRFRCLVNHDGILDQRSMYYATEELWFPEWENGGPYFAVPEKHEEFNPVRFVDRWRTPMLVIHGELDYRVPLTQGLATFTALQRRGIESRLIVFPDENHWVLKPNNSVYWHAQVNAWLHRYLDD
jgi:dipeptidyl aminopeptidase/acylaminoacyl peptidase